MRLDRLVARLSAKARRDIRQAIASGRVRVDGAVTRDGLLEVDEFAKVELDNHVLQLRERIHLMLHKPAGYLSATTDPVHPTVMDLLGDAYPDHDLHLAGRLDRASTGLLLLTNDGGWSRRLTLPEKHFPKVYLVETADPVSPETAGVFASGIYFAYEDLVTAPAMLEVVALRTARVTLCEGKYHQVKRMFHAVGNRVTSLHRESVAHVVLDANLAPGEWRRLRSEEVAGI